MITRLTRIASTAWLPLLSSSMVRIISQSAKAGLLVFPAWAFVTDPRPSLAPFILTMVVLALVAAGGRWAEQVTGHAAAFRLLASMRIQLFEALVRRGRAPKAAAGGQLLAVATRDINLIEVFFAHTLAPSITAAIATIAGIWWVIADDALGAPGQVIILAGLVLAWVLPFLRHTGNDAAIRGQIAQQFSEDARGRVEIASLQAEWARLSHLDQLEDSLFATVSKTGWLNAIRSAVSFLWPWLAAGGLLVTTGRLLPAVIVVAAAPIFQALEGFARTLPQALESAKRYFAELDHPVEIPEPTSPVDLPAGPLSVELKDVSLGYGGVPVIEGYSLKIPAGGRYGIVGTSGSGKSTIADALVRLIEPSSGEVLIGGINVASVPTKQLRCAVGLIEQSPVVLAESVYENLKMGNQDLDRDKARYYLDQAHGHDIELDAPAQQLSGGQKQRVSIARVLARRPRVLILDEATSHQDAIGQSQLTQMLAGLEDTTVIIIAHRPEALVGVDEVLKLGA